MGVAGCRVALVDIADVEDRLGRQQLRALQRQLLLRILRLDEPRGPRIAQQIQRLAEHARLDLGLLVALLRLLGEGGDALFEAFEIGEHQLGLDRFGVGHRIDPALDMGHVAALEAAQNVDDRVDLADVAEELVAEPFAGRGAAHEPGDVDEFELGLDLLGRFGDLPDAIETRIRHGDSADVRLDRAERIIGRLRRRRLGQRVEQGGLADIRQPDDSATKAHDFSLSPMGSAPLALGRSCSQHDLRNAGGISHLGLGEHWPGRGESHHPDPRMLIEMERPFPSPSPLPEGARAIRGVR